MSVRMRDRTIALAFVAASFALAFWQRPGWATSDTKIDLHVDPAAFVSEVWSVWSPSIDLGAVQGAQYSGYLWPMGPFFAALHEIGLSPWVAHRVWLGLVFAISAWGMLRLLDALVGRPRGLPHLLGAGFYLLNPYTVIFTGRTSLILLGYAVLPWLLLVVHRGVRASGRWRDWGGWWWAAAFALVLTSIGGGINAAVVGWMLVGPLVLLLYEPLIGAVRWREAGAFLVRVGVLGVLASLWWIAPLLVHVSYGVDFLQFTEQPRSIWGTNSATEALRLMAYWTSYIGVGFYGASRPLFTEAGTLLFNPVVVVATLAVPAIAVAGFAWTRGWRYGPFLLLLVLVGVAIEVAGFPNGTPARDGMEWLYRNVPLVRFMRTTQKAAPLVAAGVAGLLALFVQVALQRLRQAQRGWVARFGPVALPVAVAALILLGALPLVRGTAVEEQIAWEEIPEAWTEAGRDLDRELTRNSRAVVLPGQIFANYTWGGTTDAILPRVTERPVAVRYETPYSDPRANDMLWTVDRLVQQRRLLPGQLVPMLRTMGAGAVVSGSDDDTSRSGAVNAAAAAEELAAQGLDEPSRSYGPERYVPPPRGELGPGAELPQVRRYDLPPSRGLVSVAPAGPPVIVDGSAEGLAGLAAFGALPRRVPILYAGDLRTGVLRRYAASGAEVVITDTNRRRRFVPEFGHQNLGTTLAADETIDENFALIEPFPDRGSDAQTVAALEGARYLRAPSSGGLLEFPEYAAMAAFDGDLDTVWAADRYLHPRERWIEIGFERPRDVPYVDLWPIRDWRGIETEVDVGGKRARLGPGRNRVRAGLEDVSSLRITITEVDQPPGDLRGNGGFREVRIPGLRLRMPLRPPVLAARALAGRDLSRVALTYLFERTTADGPFRRDRHTGSPLLELASNRRDPEKQLHRVFFSPAARSYDADAWVYPDVEARDSELDRLAGLDGPVAFESSGRFHNQFRFRASSAFDGDPKTAWIGIWARPSAPYPWIAWRAERALELKTLRLTPAPAPTRRVTAVRASWPGGGTQALRVSAGGRVTLPETVRTRTMRLTVVDTLPAEKAPSPAADGGSARSGAPAFRRPSETRAVGIGSLEVPGLPGVERARASRSAPIRSRCGDAAVRAGNRRVPLRPQGALADLEAGRPLRARACADEGRGGLQGPDAVLMGDGVQRVRSLPATFSIHILRLRSPAPDPQPVPAGAGRVLDSGKLSGSSVDGVRVALDSPAWLVLGQSFSEGWRASCDGRSLGKPLPVNGYANGWGAPASCREVTFEFRPQDLVRAGYAISGVVCALLLAFLLAGWLRGRRAKRPAA
ncbi:MAG TPA: alpha-(1-_3)-arabinofuranosyltransferase family protein, partial [Thermoleophilaceae bacterium]|nr:alpha-(1->3)-arabinofuranosyltransferase family protein [Thermoleophilaceae bacterium]